METQKETIVNINQVVMDNYDKIKAGTYEWSDNEVLAVYKMVGQHIQRKKYFINKQDKEDFIQTVSTNFFTKYIKGYDINKNTSIVTFFYKCIDNEFGMHLRLRDTKQKSKSTSLNNIIKDDLEYVDTLKDETSTMFDHYILRNWKRFLQNEFEKTIFLKEIKLHKTDQTSLATRYGASQETVSRLMRTERDIIVLRAINNKIPIPEKYQAEINATLKKIDNTMKKDARLKYVDNYSTLEKVYASRIETFAKKHNIKYTNKTNTKSKSIDDLSK